MEGILSNVIIFAVEKSNDSICVLFFINLAHSYI